MSYITQTQLQDRIGDELYILASDDQGQLDTVRITEAIQDADDEIDSYLAHAYSLPLPTVPRILERVCADLAVYYLARGVAQREELTERYEKHVKWLRMVAENKVSLGLPVAQEPDASESSFHGEGRNDFKKWNP